MRLQSYTHCERVAVTDRSNEEKWGQTPFRDQEKIFMRYTGRCLCGYIRYELSGSPKWVAVCHCRDCQRSAGAPMVSWAIFSEADVKIEKGTPKTINSSGVAMRSFCPECGTGLFYRNAQNLPGLVDVQTSTLDDPSALPPTVQVQTAERQSWVTHLGSLTEFERYPSAPQE